MRRLLPFRITDEHNVLNMFALDDAYINENITGNSYGDEGVFVKVISGNLAQDPVLYGTNSYQGKTNYPFVFDQMYPANPLRVAPANSGDGLNFLGITLEQTAKYDENGEKMSIKSDKRAENSCVLPGESVKILMKGVVTLSSKAFEGTLNVGSGIKLGTTSGKVTGCALTDSARIGKVIATGSRTTAGDYFSGQTALVEFGI